LASGFAGVLGLVILGQGAGGGVELENGFSQIIIRTDSDR
jgi:hypothetical protein